MGNTSGENGTSSLGRKGRMILLLPVISILFSMFCLFGSLFFFFKPALTIEIQKRFYEKINWRIEPISMQKEIRNTKIMGLFLVTIALLAIAYIFIRII